MVYRTSVYSLHFHHFLCYCEVIFCACNFLCFFHSFLSSTSSLMFFIYYIYPFLLSPERFTLKKWTVPSSSFFSKPGLIHIENIHLCYTRLILGNIFCFCRYSNSRRIKFFHLYLYPHDDHNHHMLSMDNKAILSFFHITTNS